LAQQDAQTAVLQLEEVKGDVEQSRAKIASLETQLAQVKAAAADFGGAYTLPPEVEVFFQYSHDTVVGLENSLKELTASSQAQIKDLQSKIETERTSHQAKMKELENEVSHLKLQKSRLEAQVQLDVPSPSRVPSPSSFPQTVPKLQLGKAVQQSCMPALL